MLRAAAGAPERIRSRIRSAPDRTSGISELKKIRSAPAHRARPITEHAEVLSVHTLVAAHEIEALIIAHELEQVSRAQLSRCGEQIVAMLGDGSPPRINEAVKLPQGVVSGGAQ